MNCGGHATFCVPGVPVHATRLGLGGAPTGGHGWGPRDDVSAAAAVVEALDAGITFFDTADVYGLGLAEEILGTVLGRCSSSRSGVVIATKGGVAWDSTGHTWRDSSPTHLRHALEASLRRLRTDCIDLYYLHWTDGTTPLAASVEALTMFRTQGKVRAIGVCNIKREQLSAISWAGLAAVQVKGNLLEPTDLLAVSDEARRIGATVVCSSALADGLLTGAITADRQFGPNDHRSRYPLFQPGTFEIALQHVGHLADMSRKIKKAPTSVALRWLLQSRLADAVLTGSTSARHIRENLDCLNFNLTQEQMALLAARVPLESAEALTQLIRQV